MEWWCQEDRGFSLIRRRRRLELPNGPSGPLPLVLSKARGQRRPAPPARSKGPARLLSGPALARASAARAGTLLLWF